MSEQDRDTWSNDLRSKYGIAAPEASATNAELFEDMINEEFWAGVAQG
jgi:hypothetical protein